jgi:hypothetical protein
MAEVGLPDQRAAWAGIVAPGSSSRTSSPVGRDIIAVLALPDVRKKLAANQTIIETIRQEFRTLIAAYRALEAS